MSSKSNDQGRAYEFAYITVLKDTLSTKRNVEIVHNKSYETNKTAWEKMSDTTQNTYLTSAEATIETILELEPRLEENDGKLLTLEFLKDEEGIKGDVRDVKIKRPDIEWEIGLSLKHNHDAAKHSRLSHKLDFGKEWFDIPCSNTYWNNIKPVFNYIAQEKANNMNWRDLPNKDADVYVPLLNAFMAEVKRAYNEDNSLPKKMLEYMIGKKDYHKVISKDNKRLTLIRTFNVNGTLNKPSEIKVSAITVPIVELPTRIIALDFKANSTNTVEMYLDNGWQIKFRLHSAKSKVESSLKFDIEFVGMPPSVLTFSCSWN